MQLSDISDRLMNIKSLIIEAEEDRVRYQKYTELNNSKDKSDISYVNYSAVGMTIEQLSSEQESLILILMKSINKIKSSLHRRILKKKYVDGMTNKSISEELGYSYGYTRTLISQSSAELQKIIDDI